MLFIENTGFSINGDSASSQLGKETGYWIFPLKGDKPFKIATEALLPRLSLTLEKLGIKVSEDVLTKALRTHSTKELQLAEAMSGKAVSKELPIVIEKTAPIRTPNIAPSQIRTPKPLFNFTGSAAKQMSRPERTIPIHIIEDIIKNPIAVTKDPQGSLKGARMYYSRMYRNGKLYNVEVLYDKELNQISHFTYDRKAMGPLEKIQN